MAVVREGTEKGPNRRERVGGRCHVKVDGQGYLVRLGSYRRSGAASSGAWKRWDQTDWRGGCGRPVDGSRGEAGSRSGRWWRGFGIDISEGRLALGAGFSGRVATGETGLAAMCSFGGALCGVSGQSGRVRRYTPGSGWDVVYEPAGEELLSLGDTPVMTSGEELSAVLWAAREKASVVFEDLDGAVHQVHVGDLEEKLGELVQERGAQTLAMVELVEG